MSHKMPAREWNDVDQFHRFHISSATGAVCIIMAMNAIRVLRPKPNHIDVQCGGVLDKRKQIHTALFFRRVTIDETA